MSITRSGLTLMAVLLLTACGGGGQKTPEPAQQPAPAPEPAPTPEPEAALEPQKPDAPRRVAPNTPVAPAAPVGATTVRVAVGDTGSGLSWSRVSETGGGGYSAGSRNATVRSKAQARAFGVRTGTTTGSEEWIADRIALQPGLRDVRAHGAWRRDLTGAGVRIVVRDDPLDPEAEEIQGRTSTEGAVLGYWSHDSYFGGCSSFSDGSCREVEVESAEAARAWIADYLSKNPYPSDDDSVFVRITRTDEYFEVPALFEGESIGTYFQRDPNRSHGTMVASVAAGKHLGVAPGANLVSQAVPFEYGDGEGQYGRMNNLAGEVWSSSYSLPVEVYEAGIRGVIVPGGGSFFGRADAQRKAEIDEGFAKAIREGMAGADIVNRSYGYGGDWSDRARDTRTALEGTRARRWKRNGGERSRATSPRRRRPSGRSTLPRRTKSSSSPRRATRTSSTPRTCWREPPSSSPSSAGCTSLRPRSTTESSTRAGSPDQGTTPTGAARCRITGIQPRTDATTASPRAERSGPPDQARRSRP